MIRLPTDFKEFLRLLDASGVEYLVIGGYAVGFYGHPRATGDMDIWVASSEENAARVVQALRSFGFDSPDLSTALFTEVGQIVRMGLPPMRLELLTEIDGVEFEGCYARRHRETIDGVVVSLISLADLRTNKAASGRHKDLADLEELPQV